jgi:flagellar biosynthesis/type III secretory pathway M-ring protein FliF/YscJ
VEQLRRILGTIGKYLGGLTATQKLLVASLAIILGMTLFLVAQYAGRPAMVELLPASSPEENARAAAALRAAGIRTAAGPAGSIMVAPDDRPAALAQVLQSGQGPADTSVLFRNILDKQTWRMSRRENDQLYLMALQNELAGVIGHFTGVRSAAVMLDVPEANGLGASVRKPTASVTVFTSGGSSLPQATIDAIAHLVSGARAGLDVSRVRVIENTTAGSRQRKPSDDADVLPTTYLEHASRVETQTREKISELLAYIPGVIVAVTAQVDVTRTSTRTQENLPLGQGSLSLPSREKSNTTTQSSPTSGGDPGLRANQNADPTLAAGAAGPSLNQTDTEDQFENHVGKKTQEVIDPKGMPTLVAVTVNVPRGYVASLLRAAQPAASNQAGGAGGGGAGGGAGGGGGGGADQGPTEQQISDFFTQSVRPAVQAAIMPHVRAMTAEANRTTDPAALARLLEGQVAIAMIPLDLTATLAPAQAGLLGGLLGGGSGGSGGGLLMSGGLIEKGVLGTLAVVALGMMFLMVRKASRKAEMPSAEELVGLPPTLETKSDLIGEADESETPMAGIEVDEGEVRSQKLLEQVQALVKDNPDSAAKLINRWVTPDQ